MARQLLSKPASESEADARFTPGLFALLLGGLIVVMFPGVIFGRETFYYRDFGVFGYPLAHYQRECFWRGELPLWNPLNICGMPFLAQWNTLTLYPPALFYLVFPLSWALGVFNLGHLFLAGLGMYFLARRWTDNRFAASVAGIVFAFNGLTWHSLMWPNDIAGLGWMPWVVLTVEQAWRIGGRRIVWAALAGGMQMLSGAPEIILLTWSFLGVLCLAQLFHAKDFRMRRLLRFISVVFLVTGLAAAQLLPFLQLLPRSQRDAGFSAQAGWAMPWSGLANFLAPMFHTYPASQGVFVQHGQYWIASYYTGVGALFLAAMIFARPKQPRIWLLIAVAIFSIWMALGWQAHLYSIVSTLLPAIGFVRYPIKFVVLAVFIIPVLAAYGMKRQSTEQSNGAKPGKIIPVIALLIWALLAVIVWWEWKYPDNGDDWIATWHNIFGRAVFIGLVAGVLLMLGRVSSVRLQSGLRIALLLLLWLDVRTHATQLSPTVPRSVYAGGLVRTELNLKPQADAAEPRFMASAAAMEQVHSFSLTNAAQDYLCRRMALFDNCNLLDEVPKVDGFYSLNLRKTLDVVSLLYSPEAKRNAMDGLKDFLMISQVNPPGTNAQNALNWIARPNPLPLVTAGQQVVFADETNSIFQFLDPQFNPRETVSLPLEAQSVVHAKRAEVKLDMQHGDAQHLTLQADATAPAMVVVAQAFYEPWHAYVDGRRVKLWRANHGFQAVEIAAGKHQVKLIYEDRVFEAGVIISLLSILTLGGIWYFNRGAWTGKRAFNQWWVGRDSNPGPMP